MPSKSLQIKPSVATNPVYRCILNGKNPFILLPIYENADLHQEVKTELNRLLREHETWMITLYGSINPETVHRNKRHGFERLKDRRTRIIKHIQILEQFKSSLDETEIFTWDLL